MFKTLCRIKRTGIEEDETKMSDYEDVVKKFWDLRKSILRTRKFLIAQCFGGIISQMIAVGILGPENPGFWALITFGTMIFVIGIVFLIKNNHHVDQIDKQGDKLFYRDPNWREKNG